MYAALTLRKKFARSGLTDERGGQAARGAETSGIIGNMVLVISGCYGRKNFSENVPHFGHPLLECFASHVLGRKRLKNVGFKGHETIRLPGSSLVLARPSVLPTQCVRQTVGFPRNVSVMEA